MFVPGSGSIMPLRCPVSGAGLCGSCDLGADAVPILKVGVSTSGVGAKVVFFGLSLLRLVFSPIPRAAWALVKIPWGFPVPSSRRGLLSSRHVLCLVWEGRCPDVSFHLGIGGWDPCLPSNSLSRCFSFARGGLRQFSY